jgi:hypothetical protein
MIATVKVVVSTVTLTAFSNDVATTRAIIQAVADDVHLRVDHITERRALLGRELSVTVTGTGEQIEALRETFARTIARARLEGLAP